MTEMILKVDAKELIDEIKKFSKSAEWHKEVERRLAALEEMMTPKKPKVCEVCKTDRSRPWVCYDNKCPKMGVMKEL